MASDRSDPRTARARLFRNAPTPAEKRLWRALKVQAPAGHFRRQAPVGPYFADFAHFASRLIVEIDGDSHATDAGRRRDDARTSDLEAAGFRILRFWNAEVFENLHGVVETILIAAAAQSPPTPVPSPPQAGGGEPPPR